MEQSSQMTEAIPVKTTIGKRSSQFRWTVMALAFVITIINYLDRTALSYAIGPLKREFGFNDAQFGFIASAFGIGYMVMTLGGGILVDRFGARRMWALSAIVWSGMTALMGVASSFWMLFSFRTLLGIAEGPSFPALSRTVTDWLPMSERARATAIGLAAVPLASVIGAPLISHLIVYTGWKMMFVILGSLGIGWAFIWLWLFRDYPENSQHVSQQELSLIREGAVVNRELSEDQRRKSEMASGKTTWKFMLFNPALMSNNYAFFAFGYMLFFAVTWLPGYLETTYNVQLKEIGLFLIAPWLTGAVLVVLAGYLSDWLWMKTGSTRIARSHLIWVCQLLSGLCFLPVVFVHSLPVALTLLSLGIGLGLMPNAAFYALNSDLARDRAATSLGLMDCFFAAAGIAAPAITGMLAQSTGNFNAAILLLVAFTLTSVCGIILFQHCDPNIQKADG